MPSRRLVVVGDNLEGEGAEPQRLGVDLVDGGGDVLEIRAPRTAFGVLLRRT
jgi:hypothetical protein